jgi:hypothetical protein
MMIQIKRFVDKVSLVESKQGKDVVLPISEARGLRDEIAKLLADLTSFNKEEKENKVNEIIEVQIKGGSFK